MENPYAAPQSEIFTPGGTPTPLTWKQILFSFEGRIPRRTYWGASILLTLFNMALGFMCGLVFGGEGALFATLVSLPTYWCVLAISTKRWHDRDKSGWWNLLQAVLMINPLITLFVLKTPSLVLTGITGICGLWVLVSLGCIRGTVGPNKYGEDPT